MLNIVGDSTACNWLPLCPFAVSYLNVSKMYYMQANAIVKICHPEERMILKY